MLEIISAKLAEKNKMKPKGDSRKSRYERCLKHAKEQGDDYNEYAVCEDSVGKPKKKR